MLEKVVFLDRDGVINRDSRDYIKSVDEFEFLPGSLAAIARLHRHGRAVFVVTNQSALARNMIDLAGLEKIHEYMKLRVRKAGGLIRGVYFCPHMPGEGCECRKPSPGLLLRAARDHGVNLASAVMVGDKWTDIECAFRAGCGSAFLVASGLDRRPDVERSETYGDFRVMARNLEHAVDLLIGDE
jgi:D-glycero-D-manno-heptose 1,7-bisphosphate phosphatase